MSVTSPETIPIASDHAGYEMKQMLAAELARLGYSVQDLGASSDEPSDYPDRDQEGYGKLRRELIDPIERSYALTLRISRAVANLFGAHG